MKKKIKKVKTVGKVKYEFMPIKARKFVEIDLDFVENPEWLLGVELVDVTDAIVKVNIRILEEDLHKLSMESIQSALDSAFYIKKIIPKIVKEKTVRIKSITIDSTPIDAVRQFMEFKKPKNSEAIMEKAERLMRDLPGNEYHNTCNPAKDYDPDNCPEGCDDWKHCMAIWKESFEEED